MSVNVKEMLEAGVHFGHQKSRWNPKMSPYIFTERNGVHIFDLTKTEEKLTEAKKAIAEIIKNNGTILFVGTKKQATEIIKEAATSCNMPYVTERWLGGMLTNFGTIFSRIKTLKTLEEKIANNKFATKKQLVVAQKKVEKLIKNLGGISSMDKLPEALFVVDIVREHNAVGEAKKLGIPVIAIVDSNGDPDKVDYLIPGNDDAVGSVKLLVNEVAEVINNNRYKEKEAKKIEEK